ncbi:hypothetical protein B0T19DRAFT_402441 [Cercophora scortea]|uniref:Uncharacterized protein n=1 Tax=Cercophora scortea TaxID=314031 RepID=A0AAE0IFM2_9PEZI|nr:hypothetical protein B0T19DRAFT_402441 [Cercophora scortea]
MTSFGNAHGPAAGYHGHIVALGIGAGKTLVACAVVAILHLVAINRYLIGQDRSRGGGQHNPPNAKPGTWCPSGSRLGIQCCSRGFKIQAERYFDSYFDSSETSILACWFTSTIQGQDHQCWVVSADSLITIKASLFYILGIGPSGT